MSPGSARKVAGRLQNAGNHPDLSLGQEENYGKYSAEALAAIRSSW